MNVEHHLKQHNLRITNIRKEIFGYIANKKAAVSHSELELVFDKDFDRVTIYRTLNSFLDKGILHKVPTDSGAAIYALCHDDCSSDEHLDNHVHFKCNECKQLLCLHHSEIPMIELPKGFKANNATLLYEGVCPDCNA